MAIKCGFFNAINEDRKYTAEDMCRPYHRLVSNGVFAEKDGSPSVDLQVLANNDMTVTVKRGEGIFFDHWLELDEDLLFNIELADQLYTRIDSVVVKIDTNVNTRAGSIEILKGTPSSNPAPPVLTRTTSVYMYRLANVTITANKANIRQDDIEDTRPTGECGFITSLVNQPDISSVFIQWQAQFTNWFNALVTQLQGVNLIKRYTSTHRATSNNEISIPIGISGFIKDTDWLNVYINGLRLIPDVDYDIVNNEVITLTLGIDKDTVVAFEAIRVIGEPNN